MIAMGGTRRLPFRVARTAVRDRRHRHHTEDAAIHDNLAVVARRVRTVTRRRSAAHHRRLGRAFTRLWLGFTLASSGDGVIYGAVPLLAVVVDPHPFAVSAVIAADKLPWLLMALPAGQVADRFERGRVASLANLLRAAAMFAAVALIASGQITLGLLIGLVLVNASGRAIYYSAFQAMVPSLVDSRDLEQANGIFVRQ